MSEANDLVEEEAFIASSFVDFHTEEPASPGDWIPMTEEEASGRWESWITEHDRQVAERARVEFADELTRKGVHTFDIHSIRRAAKGEQ